MSEVLNLKMNGTGQAFVDSSASGHAITAVGDTYQVQTAITNRRQAYFFDGDSDYITVPDSPDWEVGASTSQDYTIDCWVKHNDHVSNETYVAQIQDNNNYWIFKHLGGTGIRFAWVEGGVTTLIDGAEITDRDWHHVIMSKVTSGGPTVEYGLYIDGVQVAYRSDTNVYSFTGPLTVGARGGSPEYLDGHMKNIRISTSNVFSATPNVGKTDTITVPTADPVADANTKLLLTGVTENLNTPLNSTAWFDGDSDYLSALDSPDWNFQNDFTIEYWIRFNTLSLLSSLFSQSTSGADYWFQDYYNGAVRYGYRTGGAAQVTVLAAAFTFNLNQWYHIAIVRSGNNHYAFVDGTQIGSTPVTAGRPADQAVPLRIGWNPTTPGDFHDGYLKEIRMSDSARYTANFTPSTEPFVDDANTVLLLHTDGVPDDTDNTNGWLTDASTGGVGSPHTVTANGTAQCKYIEDYRNRTVRDDSGNAHIGTMVGTAKNDWITVEGNGAGAFDGTGDYLSTLDSADWNYGTGNFTVHFWARPTDLATIGFFSQSVDNNNFYGMNYDSSSITFKVVTGGVTLVNCTNNVTLRLNEWYHFTAIRGWGGNANDWAITVNGSPIATLTDSDAITDLAALFTVGRYYTTGSAEWLITGNMDNVIVDKGTAIWTIPFIPPVYPTSGASGNAFQAIMF